MTLAALVDMQDVPVGIGRGELGDETTAGARAEIDGGAQHNADGAVLAMRPLAGRYRLIDRSGGAGWVGSTVAWTSGSTARSPSS